MRIWVSVVVFVIACEGGHSHHAPPVSSQGGAAGAESSAGEPPLASGGQTAGTQGGENAGESGAAGESGRLGAFAELARSFCAAARSCCAAAGEPLDGLSGCESGFSAQVDAVALAARGSVTLDAEALAACTAAYTAAADGCLLTDVATACHGIVKGTRALGDACSEVAECDRTNGARLCVRDADSDVGTCTEPARGEAGSPCARSCGVGADCSSTSISAGAGAPTALCYEEDGLFCDLDGTCAPLAATGDDCELDDACGTEGYCTTTCTPRAAAGQACDFDVACTGALACEEGTCAAAPLADGYVCLGHLPLPLE